MDIETQIEQYLLSRRDWVSAAEICSQFGIRERALRQLGDHPGLCSRFAISHPRLGLKHVSCASTAEYLHAKHAARRHAIGELRRQAALDHSRHQVTATISHPAIMYERDSGQLLMPLLNKVEKEVYSMR